MFLTWAYLVYFICSETILVQAEFQQTAFQILPSRNVSNADHRFFARSLTDCASGCMNIYNRSTATYSTNDKQCYVKTSGPEVIVYTAVKGVITVTQNKEQVLSSQYGTDFMTGFMNNGNNNEGVPYLLIVSSVPTPTNVWVTIPYLAIHQEHHLLDGHLYLQYSNSVMPEMSSIVTENGIQVTSDQPVALYSFNRQQGSADGTLEFPKHLLGHLYIVDTHNSTSWGTGQIVVIAVTNSTQVRFVFPSGSNKTIMLNKFETYQYQATAAEPLAGTMISANTSISVHAGHMCANVPDHSVQYCDILVTAVPPVETFDDVFIVPYQRPRTSYSIGIAAPFDSTEVTILDRNGTLQETVQMNQRDSMFREFSSSQIISVKSTQNILVTQYGHGSEGVYGDPSLTVILATNRFGSRYNFAVPTIFDDPSVVSIVIESLYDFAGLMLNGSPLVITESTTVVIPGEGDFNVMYVNVSKNVTYFLYHNNPNARFGAWLYARNTFEEYTTVLGYNL